MRRVEVHDLDGVAPAGAGKRRAAIGGTDINTHL
jgi:hypothetical protein